MRILISLLFILCLTGLVGCDANENKTRTNNTAEPTPINQDKILYKIYDLVYESTSPPTVFLNKQKLIFDSLFKEYLTSSDDCVLDSQIVPTIKSAVKGSFTEPNGYEIAYLIDVGECNRSSNFTSHLLVIVSNDKVVARFDVLNNEQILTTSDLDSDKVDELLIGGVEMHQGPYPYAELVSVKNKNLRLLYKAPNDITDDSVIVYTKNSHGQMPALRIVDNSAGANELPAQAVTPITTPTPLNQVTRPHPVGAKARCRDGSYSYSTGRGTCSHHGGVAQWLY